MNAATIPEEINIVQVCEHMHWTYDQYMDSPQWFLDVLAVKMIEDGAHQKKPATPKG